MNWKVTSVCCIEAILPEKDKVLLDHLRSTHTSSLTTTCKGDVIKVNIYNMLITSWGFKKEIVNSVANEMNMWSSWLYEG